MKLKPKKTNKYYQKVLPLLLLLRKSKGLRALYQKWTKINYIFLIINHDIIIPNW